MKIIIADTDNKSINDIKQAFSQYLSDWDVSIIDSGKGCLSIIENNDCPDAFIIGMRLKDMTGLELIRQIRDDSDIPIIFLSDDDNIQALVMVFDMGVNDFIVVPINRAIFIARLKALIRRSIWDIVLKNSGLWNSYIRNMV